MEGVPAHIAALEPFLAMEIMERGHELERAGHRVVHLELGEPDAQPVPEVAAACSAALAAEGARYTDSRGRRDLREAIAAEYARQGIEVDPDRVVVTAGTSAAMLLTFSLLLEPGAEVVVPTPHYPCYPNFVRLCGGRPVFCETHAEDGYRVDVAAVEALLTERTAAIVVASPANPTGAVQPPDTLRALAGLGVPLVSDEIYHGLVYAGAETLSAATLGGDCFVLDGFSKRFAMTGYRLGWMLVPEWAARPTRILAQNLFLSVNSFVQAAGIAALAHGQPGVAKLRDDYRGRRTRMVAGLRALGFGVVREPEGAFYVLADARRFGDDSRRLALELLERAQVGTAPGIDFGEAAEGMLRFSYAVAEAEIEEGLARLARVLPALEAEREASR